MEWNMTNVEGIAGGGEKGPDGSVKSMRPEFDEASFSYPSSDGKGYEPIVIARPHQYGNDGVDRLLVREVPGLIRDRILQSVEYGNLRSTLSHYGKFIDENADLFAPHDSMNLKTLFSEGKQAPTREARDEWVKKVRTYLNGIYPDKNIDYKK